MLEKMSVASGRVGDNQGLLTRLLDAVKQCQIRFGGKSELATESDGRVCCLCAAWEAVLQHGLLHNNKALSTFKQMTELTGLAKISSGINILGDLKNLETEPTFWHCIREVVSPHEQQRYALLKEISSDAGRGRAWLRSALNEHSLERFMHIILDRSDLLKQYYEDWAFLRDQEKASMLPNMAAGLGSILFAIIIDKDTLNTIKPASGLDILLSTSAPAKSHEFDRFHEEPRPVIATDGTPQDEKQKPKDKKKKIKKKPVKIVSFDEADISSYSSSPSSALISPCSVTSGVDISSASTSAVTTATATTVIGVESTVLSAIPGSSWSDGQSSIIDVMGDSQSSVRTEKELEEIVDNNGGKMVHGSQSSTADSHDLCLETGSPPRGQIMSDTLKQSDCSDAEHKYDTTSVSSKDSSISSSGFIIEDEKWVVHGSRSLLTSSKPPVPVKSTVGIKPISGVYEGLIGKGVEGRLRHSDSITSTSSLNSNGSANSHTSWPSEGEFTVGDMMSPVSPDGEVGDALMFTAHQPPPSLTKSASVDYGEVPMYNEWTQSARVALDVAQNGMKQSAMLRTQGDGRHSPQVLAVTNDTMSSDELKQAVIAMMGRKDEVEHENRLLRQTISQEQETCSALRAEIDEVRQSSHSRQERDENSQKTLSRENDLLKHQLKKYVNAVQLLRRQGAQPQDFPGLHMDAVVPTAIPSPPPFTDLSQEASEYEQKLIQVAEMHGELMEFNGVLQKQLLNREATIGQLTTELVSLRGPLPERPPDDNVSVSSESNAGALISVWIPSAFLRGRTSDAYHVYQVYIRIREEEWNVYRRYSEFSNLHTSLKKKLPVINSFNFPKKKALGNKDLRFVEERRKKLEGYIRKVINLFTRNGGDLCTNASKQKLVAIVPFFGESAPEVPDNSKSKGKRGKTSADSNRSSSQGQGACYTGL